VVSERDAIGSGESKSRKWRCLAGANYLREDGTMIYWTGFRYRRVRREEAPRVSSMGQGGGGGDGKVTRWRLRCREQEGRGQQGVAM
jgi:hypothetical protein